MRTPLLNLRTLALYLAFVAIGSLSACTCEDSEQQNDATAPDAGESTNNATTPDNVCPPDDPSCADPCAAAECREDQLCRIDDDNRGICECPAGTSEVDGACVLDEACTDTTCGGNGNCTEGTDGPECSCDTGWSGEFCDACDAASGYQPDGAGGCTDDPCDLVTCEGDQICVVTDDEAACECPAGTHIEDGFCVTDETCGPTSCAGNGECNDDEGTVRCTCEDGWAPPFCQQCDAAGGYHPDGMGGCTTDPCLPNPCTTANRTSCVQDGPSYACECDSGYHLDSTGTCIPDESCEPSSCSGNGTCNDSTLEVVCTCNTGYVGDRCDTCDSAAGYHPDGMGGCTNDPCLPNPCSDPNKTVCTSSSSSYTCGCDAGYHPDGMGGCTDDPCLPDPCAANNQACRDNGGVAECYTPNCDDQNPCTDDNLVNGSCQYTNRADGSACSTSACTDNEVCTAGVCGGGSARNCDDNNPCTDDSCDPFTGCVSVNDDTNVPDDGIACTDDTCTAGLADHVPNTANCDDGAYCNGDEICRPTDPNAGADGCVVENVPTAPASPSPCQYYGACDESSDSFPLMSRSAGDACNDGVYCTSGDTCDAQGACVGSYDMNCDSATCTSTSPLPNTIDIASADLTINTTIGGQPLPATSGDSSRFYFYAVAKDTGVRHYFNEFRYSSSTDNLQGPWPTDRLIPGVYDIVLDRYPTSRTYPSNIAPYAERVLMSDVVLTAGANTIDVDIPITELTINTTIGGQPLPATSGDSSRFYFYAVSQDTGVRHYFNEFRYSSSTDNLQGPWPTHSLIPGTYDIVLDRYPTSRTYPSNIAPYAERVLIDDLVVSGASQTVDVDIPITELTINTTIGGQPLPATSGDSSRFYFYAVSQDTGVRHYFNEFRYSSSTDNLQGPWPTHSLIPGTYDIVLDRYPTSRTYPSNIAPYAERVLIDDLVVSGASQTVDVDIPITELTINTTIGGQPLPATSGDSSRFYFYAVARDTGVRHYFNEFRYSSSTDNLQGPWPTHSLIPGTYDIVLDRYPTSRTYPSNIAPYGERALIEGLVVSGATQTIDVDIPITELTINTTIDGQPLPATSGDSSRFYFYAVSQDTGVRHYFNEFRYSSSTDNLQGPWPTHSLIPGTYDIVLDRYPTSRTYPSNIAPYGERVLIDDLVVSGATQTINVDIGIAAINTVFTIDGQSLPATSGDSSRFYFYAVARDTGVRHYFNEFRYSSSTDNLQGPWPTDSLIPGTYDILIDRYPTSRTYPSNIAPYGERYLGVCFDVQ